MKMHWKALGLTVAVVALTACGPAKPEGEGYAVPEGPVEAPELAADEGLLVSAGVELFASATSSDAQQVTLIPGTVVGVVNSESGRIQVRTPEGQIGWIRQALVVQGVRRAVIKTEGGASGLPQFTVVGYRPLADQVDSVEAYGAAGSEDPRRVVVPRTALSLDINDVNLVLLWRQARAETDPERKTSLLSSALGKYGASAFASMVQGELDQLSGQTTVATRPSSLIVSVIRDQAELWASPSRGPGEPVGTLAQGEQVQIVEESAEPVTIDGVAARWYKVADPAGWIWGADVQE